MSRPRSLAIDDRMADAFDDLSREESGGPHGDHQLVIFVSDPDGFPWPNVAQCFYPVQRCTITGDESTGSLATLTPVGDVFWAANIGLGIPPDPGLGSPNYVIVDECGGRWCFIWNG